MLIEVIIDNKLQKDVEVIFASKININDLNIKSHTSQTKRSLWSFRTGMAAKIGLTM